MRATNARNRAALLAAVLAAAAQAAPPPDAQRLASDPAAVQQLTGAVSLDVMTEASVTACDDMGAPSAAAARAAWVAWRERHQIAPLRMVLRNLARAHGRGSAPDWKRLTEPMRQRVLGEVRPEPVCAGLAHDLQAPGMDATALYPQAAAVARALVALGMAAPPGAPDVVPGQPRGTVVLPGQVQALAEAATRRGEVVYVKGWVQRWGSDGDEFELVQRAEAGRRTPGTIVLRFDAEPWMGREIVLRGTTSFSGHTLFLDDGALVRDASGLAPSPLPQAPAAREEVLLQRVSTPPGQGLADKDLAAIVIHGQSNFNNGTTWEEDVRFLLRDGTAYRRTGMPPDQLNVAASRQLEPQQWGRWRATGNGYEMQPQDDDGRPGAWQAVKHRAVQPWPADTKLDGSFSRGSFHGSLVLGGMSFRNSMRFTRDGRFERSSRSLGTSGSLGATLNGTMISSSSQADGSGSSSTGGGVVGGPFGTAGAVSARKVDDGASRRGRYRLSGYVLTLDFDDGHQERLLSFPVHGDADTVYVGSGSLSRDK